MLQFESTPALQSDQADVVVGVGFARFVGGFCVAVVGAGLGLLMFLRHWKKRCFFS